MSKIVVTPGRSVAAVTLPETPPEAIKPGQVRRAMAQRIDRMVKETDPDSLPTASALAMEMEGLDLTEPRPGDAMVGASAALQSALEGEYPLTADAISKDPEELDLLEQTQLSEFLAELYQV